MRWKSQVLTSCVNVHFENLNKYISSVVGLRYYHHFPSLEISDGSHVYCTVDDKYRVVVLSDKFLYEAKHSGTHRSSGSFITKCLHQISRHNFGCPLCTSHPCCARVRTTLHGTETCFGACSKHCYGHVYIEVRDLSFRRSTPRTCSQAQVWTFRGGQHVCRQSLCPFVKCGLSKCFNLIEAVFGTFWS